jgi:hypothetical protein
MTHRTKLSAPLLGLVALAWASTAGAAATDVPLRDHYLCYKIAVAKVPANVPPIVVPAKGNIKLTDQFEADKHYDATKLVSVCVPADKDVPGDAFPPHLRVRPNSHLVGYQILNTKPEKESTGYSTVARHTTDQFGMLSLDAVKPDSLLVRSSKIDLGRTTKCKIPDTAGVCAPLGGNCSNTPGGSACVCDTTAKICLPSPVPGAATPPSDINNFKCYKIKDNKTPPFVPLGIATGNPVTVTDQFGSAQYDVTKPTKICTPVDKEDEGYVDTIGHLVCYQVKQSKTVPAQAKFIPHKVRVNNANIGSAFLDVKAIKELCLPAYKDPGCCSATRITTQSTGHCRHCSVTTATGCSTNANCPGGETCVTTNSCLDDTACTQGACVSDATLKVSVLPAFAFPLGVVTTVDVGAPDGQCKHDALVQSGNFVVPPFCIQGLNFTSAVINKGCVGNNADGRGTVWDAFAPRPTVLSNLDKSGDTHEGTCDMSGGPCDLSKGGCSLDNTFRCNLDGDCTTKRCSGAMAFGDPACTTAAQCKTCNAGTRNGLFCTTDNTNATTGCPGATCPGCCVSVQTCNTLVKGTCDTSLALQGHGANTNGKIITTQSASNAFGVHTSLDIPVESITWSSSGGCPDPDGMPGEPDDLLITDFNFILSPTAGTAKSEFAEQGTPDGCAFAGAGPLASGVLAGSPAPGPCCVEGQRTTVVSAGVAFSGSAPLYDLVFSSTIPTQITDCGTFVPGGECNTLVSDPCQ